MKTAFSLLLRNRLAAFGGAVLAAMLLIVMLAPLLPLHDPDLTAPANRLLRPLADGHFLGTDHLGRDLLARLIWGTASKKTLSRNIFTCGSLNPSSSGRGRPSGQNELPLSLICSSVNKPPMLCPMITILSIRG